MRMPTARCARKAYVVGTVGCICVMVIRHASLRISGARKSRWWTFAISRLILDPLAA